jgi:Flp pilus assembly protein TadD
LGYDRDALGMHLVEYGACEIAESQFRRAIWLNPFEPRFKVHLAWCLYKEARHAEALACLAEAPDVEMDAEMETIVRLIEQGVSRKAVKEGR